MRTSKDIKTESEIALQLIGMIALVAASIVGAWAYSLWIAWDAAKGNAGAAIAGAWFTFQGVIVVVGLFMIYSYLMEKLKTKGQQQAFAANAIENAQIRQQDHASALALAELREKTARASKAEHDAAFSAERARKLGDGRLADEIDRLQGEIERLRANDAGAGDEWAVDLSAFDDDGAVVIDQR